MHTARGDSDGTATAAPSDADLVTAVRNGHTEAFGTLFQRHQAAARRMARQLTASAAEADDLVAEAFTKVLEVIRRGGGPDSAFRAYLLTAVRNVRYERLRRDRRLELHDDMSGYDQGVPFRDTAVEGLDSALAARAFASLPERWQSVLWHVEVEGETPREVGTLLGLSPNGVSALASRAREGLREAYLQQHLSGGAPPHCRPTVLRLGAWTRSRLSRRESAAVREHLGTCADCAELAAELREVNSGLRGVLAPLIIGAPWVAGYLAQEATRAAAPIAGALGSAGAATATQAHTGGAGWLLRLLRRTQRSGRQAAIMVAIAIVAALAGALIGHRGGPPPHAVGPGGAGPGGTGQGGTGTQGSGQGGTGTQGSGQGGTGSGGTGQTSTGTQGSGQGGTGQGGTGQGGTGQGGGATGPGGSPAPGGGTPVPPGSAPPPSGAPPSGAPPSSPPPLVAVSSQLSVTAPQPFGQLAAGRPGVIAIGIQNTTAAALSGVTARLRLGGGATAHPTRDLAAATQLWLCSATAAGADCDLGLLPPGVQTPLYLTVSVPAAATSVTVSGEITLPGAQPLSLGSTSFPVGTNPAAPIPVFATAGSATVVTAGNTVLSCPRGGPTSAACARARRDEPVAGWQCLALCNDAWDMAPMAPSQAQLTLPTGGQVLWAGLFWSGVDPTSTADPAVLGHPQLRLRGGPPTTLDAEVLHSRVDVTSVTRFYQGFADVTQLVRTGFDSGGLVQVDGVATTDGRGSYGGWALVVVVHAPALPRRQVTVVDGFQLVASTASRVLVSLPWLAPATGAGEAGLVAWEGDRGVGGESITADGTVVDSGDALAGHANGARYPGATASAAQTFGVDTLLAPVRWGHGTSATVAASTTADRFLLGPVWGVAATAGG